MVCEVGLRYVVCEVGLVCEVGQVRGGTESTQLQSSTTLTPIIIMYKLAISVMRKAALILFLAMVNSPIF